MTAPAAIAAVVAGFTLPPSMARDGYALREECDDDVPFLRALYATTRTAEMAASGWTDSESQAFLAQQFGAQRSHYRTRIAGCRFAVIERNGMPVGRLYLQPRDTHVHIVDITVSPDMRGKGLGTAILQAVIDRTEIEALGVGLVVDRANPALALYLKLGFRSSGGTGVRLELEYPSRSARPIYS